MSGNIKVSGTWRNASNLYVRVGGTWRTALQAYINVGGSWRIWYNTTISDTFTRANTTTGLGSTESGGILPWNSLIGNFFVSSGTARSDNAVTANNAGALTYINFNTPNATAAVGGQTTTAGIGPAVWVSAAGSWWAAIGSNGQTNTTYTYNCNCTCNGHTACNTCQNPAFGGPYTSYGYYSPERHDEWKQYSTSTTYSNSGATPVASGGTTYVYAGTASSYPSTVTTRYCTAANGADPNNTCPYSWQGYCRSDATGLECSWSCPSGGQLGAGNSTCYNCGSNSNGNVCCNAGINSCFTATTNPVTYSCSSGTYYASPPSGCTSGCCNSSTTSTWTGCSSGFSFSDSCYTCHLAPPGVTHNFGWQYNVNTQTWGYFCSYSITYYGTGTDCAICGSTFYPGGTANPSTGAGCDSYGFTCQTCTGGSVTTNYYMQIIKATSTGAPYTVVSTSADYGTQISNISITTSNNTLTATAYGTTGSSLGTLTATNTATKGNGVGIVKGHTPYNQASTGDNFSAFSGALNYVPVEYLVVAGGGAGGGHFKNMQVGAGGGGAGGVLSGTLNLNTATAQTITVGVGGTGAAAAAGSSGTNSVFASFTAIGGGGGGSNYNDSAGFLPSATQAAKSGGSGGGSGGGTFANQLDGASGTSGQGFAGGAANFNTGYICGGGGGGGATAVGGNSYGPFGSCTGGNAGTGITSSITGTSVAYAGGGPATGAYGFGSATAGGGPASGSHPNDPYTGIPDTTGYEFMNSAAANTGGGGVGASYGWNPAPYETPKSIGGGNGGSGVIVIAYQNTYPDLVISGVTYTRSTTSRPGYKVYTFTAGTGTVTI